MELNFFRRSRLAYFALIYLLVLFGQEAMAISFETLKMQIKEEKINSIEALLAKLPESTRSKYVLIFHSRSLQGASLENPRVILFGNSAKFMLSFNGNPEQRGFKDIEVADFNSETRQFEFHEILFPDENKKRTGVTFSIANPPKCLKCHGQTARPIWESHPSWPGAYGQNYHFALGQAEQQGLTHFLETQPTHPRYQFLKQVQLFANRETFAPTTRTRYEAIDNRQPPNAVFSELLNELNMQIVASQVSHSPQFKQFRYALLAALSSDCGEIEGYFSPQVRSYVGERLAKFVKSSDERNAEQEVLKEVRISAIDPSKDRTVQHVDRVDLNAFRFLVEEGLGIKTDEWTLALEKNTYDFTSSNSAPKTLERLLLPAVLSDDSELKHLVGVRSVSADDRFCAVLKRKSNESKMSLLRPAQPSMPEQVKIVDKMGHPVPSAVAKCISCHDGEVARHIPFDDPALLSSGLRKINSSHGNMLQEVLFRISPLAGYDSMPRGMNLGAAERLELENYFKALANEKAESVR